jgi:superfamily II DNA or RNA helicase
MRWRLNNVVVTVEGNDDEKSWLGRYLSYVDHRYVPGRNTYRDRQVSLYNAITDDFPAGLAKLAFAEAAKQGFKVTVQDERKSPCAPDPNADLEWLRHHPAVPAPITHQIDAVNVAVRKGRGILWLPTGSGKTEVAIGIVRLLPCRWLFFVHRADLLVQTAERFERRTGIKAGIVGDGRVEPVERFTVVMFQTAWRMAERGDCSFIEAAEGVIVDECHTAPAETFWRTLSCATNAYYRLGLSGTPLARSDGRNLLVIGSLGPVIHRVMPETLVALGLLAKPTIRMTKVSQRSDKPTWRGVYGEAVVRSKTRNAAVVDVVKRAARPCLVFVQEIAHGKALAKMLGVQGIVAEFMWGREDTAHRQAAIQRLMRGDTEVLVCSVIFQEGIDIPSLRSVVVASGGKSIIAALQRIGRGMRADASTGKTTFEVWDFADKGCGCRPDTTEGVHPGCRWLERHARARMRAYQSEGFDVLTVPAAKA